MYLPTTYVAALLLTIVSMICWGSWANTQKLSGKWRFELFYIDYVFGVLICTLVAFFTLGSLNSSEISAIDTFALTGKTKMAYAFAGGVVFNLANLLLVAAIAVAGLAVAFPVGIGLAMIIGVAWNYFLNPQGNPRLLFTGAAVVLAAIIVDAIAYRLHAAERPAAVPAPQSAAAPARSRTSTATASARGTAPARKRPGAAKGIVISVISGILMGSFYPLVELGRAGDDGLRPYADILVFTLGLFLSTFIFDFFFMLLPVQGESVEPTQYFRGTSRQHLLGLAGGAIWCIGAISNFVASSAPKEVQVGPATSYALGQGATMVSALWGLLVWREFAGATTRVRILLAAMLILFLAGLGLVSIAPLYPRS
jgi:glucose uptake protein